MTHRLVVGDGSLCYSLATALADRSGTVRVLTSVESRRDTFVEGNIEAAVADVTDPETFQAYPDVDVVVVAAEKATNEAVRAARDAGLDAQIVAYAPEDGADIGELKRLADTVIDPSEIVTDHLLARAGSDGTQMRQLQRVLRGIDRLAVVTHDNPDPDAIASAVALARLAGRAGCAADVCYYGEITHQENRAFVNLLGFDLRNVDSGAELEEYDGFALVDHSRPGVNDQLPEDLAVDVVIDHHPPRAPVEARFVDLRSDMGATSTLLVDYFDQFDVDLTEDIATGLLFGIRVDTKEFSREVSPADFDAAASLLPAANLGTLERIEAPSISAETFETIGRAIRNRVQEGTVVLSYVGQLADRDALAQSADRLLTLEDVTTTLVYGVKEGTIFVSARSRGTNLDLGETLRDAFDPIGSAGGHADMAGAQITLGVLEAVEDREESLDEIVEAVVSDRFLDAIDARAEQTIVTVYPDERDTDEYLVPDEERPETDGS